MLKKGKKIFSMFSSGVVMLSLFFSFGGFIAPLTPLVSAATTACTGGSCVPGSCGPGTIESGTCASGTTCCMPTTGTGAPRAPSCTSQGKECSLPAACEPNTTVSAGDCASYQVCCTSNTSMLTLPSGVSSGSSGGSSSGDASGLVPCGNGDNAEDCQFGHFLVLAKNVIDFLLFTIAVPIAAISFAWAGWLYLSAAGNESKVKEAHKLFGYVVLGLCLALAAWLIVNALITGLGLGTKYNPLTGGTFGQ